MKLMKEKYARQIAKQSKGIVTIEDAKEFVSCVFNNSHISQKDTLDCFEKFTNNMIEKHGAVSSVAIVSFFTGVLNANGIITQVELEVMNKNFTNKILKLILPNQQ